MKRAVTDIGSLRFSWLLRQRDISYAPEERLEEAIVVKGTRPDFALTGASRLTLVEVESLEAAGPLDGITARFFTGDMEKNSRRLRGAVDHAARQFQPYRDDGVPMLAVIDNHRRVGVDTSFEAVLQIFGELTLRGRVNLETGATEEKGWHHGRGQVLHPSRKTYISAVAVLLPKEGHARIEEPVTQVRPMRLRIVHNPYADQPLSDDLFCDPEDEHHRVVDGYWRRM